MRSGSRLIGVTVGWLERWVGLGSTYVESHARPWLALSMARIRLGSPA